MWEKSVSQQSGTKGRVSIPVIVSFVSPELKALIKVVLRQCQKNQKQIHLY